MANKEVAVINKKVDIALQKSKDLEVKNPETLEVAIDLKDKLKLTGKVIDAEKERRLKPARLVVKDLLAVFKPAEIAYEEAVKTVKGKIDIYVAKVEAKRLEKERVLAEQVKNEEITPEKAAEKIEKLPEVKMTGKTGKLSMRTFRSAEITDETKIPREYLSLNMVLIRKDILGGVKIPGAKLVEEKRSV